MRSTSKRFEFYTDGGLVVWGIPRTWSEVVGIGNWMVPRFEWFVVDYL